jgi:leader peptidase (prepilin peptidase)/N-methyltransferase
MLYAVLAVLFIIGAMIGSFLNVCIARLPYEKSILWPLGSRCGTCLKPILWYDNLPLVSYLVLRGRCRMCGARFSPRYFFVELITGLGIAGLFYLEVIQNVLEIPVPRPVGDLSLGLPPWRACVVFAAHATLLCFLLVASFVDLAHFEIPLPVTVTGTIVGLAFSTLCPWPWPNSAPPVPKIPPGGWLQFNNFNPPSGMQSWPIWFPLPAWLQPPGTWHTGLATGLAGVLAGTMMLRAIRFVFGLGRGREGLGIGDADLMMMAGAFLGWQAVVVAFFVSVFPALLVGMVQLIFRGGQEIPFGPSLALGTVITFLCWRSISPHVGFVFFTGPFIGALAVACLLLLLVASFTIRVVRR